MLTNAWYTLFGVEESKEHVRKLEKIDRIHQEQEDRLDRARLIVLDSRFHQRFEATTHPGEQ